MESLVATVFLRCTSAIFLIAFLSVYWQVPGLYGRNGVLPVHGVLPLADKPLEKFLSESPTLLWFMPSIGLDPEHGVELLSLLGVLVSALTLLSERIRSQFSYFIIWLLYLSIYQVGQTFLWFQWDILLLETGFLAIIVAPMMGGKPSNYNIGLWLVKWLLFRLMFASGVVKLTSHCPTWWGLTALDYHFESQCIPTPLAWYFHHSPEWFRRLSVVATYIIEIAVPFFFFAPVRSLRLLAFWLQIIFQVSIIFTGNYNFFNLLTCVLCLPLLDDKALSWFSNSTRKQCPTTPQAQDILIFLLGTRVGTFLYKVCKRVLFFAVCIVVLYWTVIYFNIRFNTRAAFVETNVAFSKSEFSSALQYFMPLTIWMAVVSLGFKLLDGLVHCARQRSVLSFISTAFSYIVLSSAAVYMFAISLVPHTALDHRLQGRLWPVVHQWHQQSSSYHLTSSYGLFRRMTGVGGRPEVVLEGSNDRSSGWKEYHFLYKPGNLSARPPIVAPHQPRLDWQMWFAALGSYQQNPWLISMVDRLLVGEPTVLDLIESNPFSNKPPKFIRGKLYNYYYTTPKDGGQAWWRREEVSEYLPPVTKDEKTVKAFLSHHNLLDRNYPHQSQDGYLLDALRLLREYSRQFSAPAVIAMLFTALAVLNASFTYIAGMANDKNCH